MASKYFEIHIQTYVLKFVSQYKVSSENIVNVVRES